MEQSLAGSSFGGRDQGKLLMQTAVLAQQAAHGQTEKDETYFGRPERHTQTQGILAAAGREVPSAATAATVAAAAAAVATAMAAAH